MSCIKLTSLLLVLLSVLNESFTKLHHVPNISKNRMHQVTLDPKYQVKLTWMVDWPERNVFFHVKNGLNKKFRWFALGFSRRGEFPKTDFCFFQRNNDKINIHIDTRTSDDGQDILIDQQQDCIFISHSSKDGIAFRRNFDTCDEDDFPFHEGTMFIYWMRGEEELDFDDDFAVPDISESDSGMTHLQLLRADLLTVPEKNVDHIDIRVKNFEIPSTDTTYYCKIQKIEDTTKKRHIVEFEPIITSEEFVHHMEVFHCEAPADVELPLFEGNCDNIPSHARICNKVISLWAMGAAKFTYPKEVGLPFGGSNYNPYIRIEIHYNNPNEVAGVVDSSGMRIKYVDKLRKYDAGVMELGLEYTDKMAIPPGQLAFPLSGYCIAECTKLALPKTGITVFGSQLHTHLRGVRIMTRHFRRDQELRELNRDDFYLNHFQEIRILRRKTIVLPGDALVTTCYYDTRGYTNATLGGFSIQDEMCVNYIHYYPATNLELCKSSVSEKTLADYFEFMKKKDHQNIDMKKGRAAAYRTIDWTMPRVNELFTMYTNEPLSMQCNRSDGRRFEGFEWEESPITEVPIQLPQPKPSCSRGGKSLRDSIQCDMFGDCVY